MSRILVLALCLVAFTLQPAFAVHKFVKNTQKLGILSITFEKAGGDKPVNLEVGAQVLAHAEALYTKSLSGLTEWTVIPAAEVAKMPGLDQLASVTGDAAVRAKLEKLAKQDNLPMEDDRIMKEALKAYMSFNMKRVEELRGEAVDQTLKEMQQKVDTQVAHYQGLPGLPVIPRSLFSGVYSESKLAPKQWELIGENLREKISAFCEQNGLDAVAIYTIRAEAGHVGDVFVIFDNRTDGHIKANATVQLLHKEGGKLNVDLGDPRMDDLAPFEMNVSIYEGKGAEAAKPENIHFGAPDNEPLIEFKKLIDTTDEKLTKKLKKELKIK